MLSSRATGLALAVAAGIVASARASIDLELMQLQALTEDGARPTQGATSNNTRRRPPWFTHAGVPVYRDERAGSQRTADEVQKWIIVLQSDATDEEVHALAMEINGDPEGHPDSGELPFVKGELDQASLQTVLDNHQNRVRYVEEDLWAHMIPNEHITPTSLHRLSRTYPWNIIDINAHLVRGKGAGVHVYVLDTGVRTTHAGFGGRAVATLDASTYPVTVCTPGDTTCADDDNGHGTHCAGTVAAETHGVADGATIHAVKVLDSAGNGYLSWIVNSLSWIMSNGITPAVVSMSLTGAGSSLAVQDSVELCVGSGIPVVVAAGNDGVDACGYTPANVGLAITVGAYGLSGTSRSRPSWSNYGTCIDVWAPGVGILSLSHTNDASLALSDGTSMACPHVAGLMARILEAYPTAAGMTPLQRFALLTTNSLAGNVLNIPASPTSPNVVPLAIPLCSATNGMGLSSTYPCDCGSALCTSGQVCDMSGAGVCTAANPGAAPASAKGDPHLTNIYGQRFDLTKPGKRVLLHIPRHHTHHTYLLDVSALAERIGEACTDLYFQELNVTGKWADVRHEGGFRYTVKRHGDSSRHENVWMSLGSLKLKVVRGKTLEGVRYLNFFVKGLGSVAMSLGGLLGEDDHSAETPPPGCARSVSLLQMGNDDLAGRSRDDSGSLAEASLA